MKTLILSLLLLTGQAPVFAAEPSAESLDRLLAVTKAQRMTEAMVQQVDASMKPMFDQAIGARNLSAEQRRAADQFMARFAEKMNKIMADELSWARMREFSLQIYREAFTQKEVDDLIAFYESPTGQAFIEKMPIVMQKSLALMQQRMMPMMERIQAAAKEVAEEFKTQQAGKK